MSDITTEQPTVNGRTKSAPARATRHVEVKPPNFQSAELHLEGLTPYVQLQFSAKAREKMRGTMEAGSTARKGTKREARDFEADYLAALHISTEGWKGIPAAAFRSAAIDACRLLDYHMTEGKMSIFVLADGSDDADSTPLVRIYGTPKAFESTVRNANGSADIRVRGRWDRWGVILRVRYDADQFTETDIVNLFARAGIQIGVGEGRPFSKKSHGMGWGQFEIVDREIREEDFA